MELLEEEEEEELPGRLEEGVVEEGEELEGLSPVEEPGVLEETELLGEEGETEEGSLVQDVTPPTRRRARRERNFCVFFIFFCSFLCIDAHYFESVGERLVAIEASAVELIGIIIEEEDVAFPEEGFRIGTVLSVRA